MKAFSNTIWGDDFHVMLDQIVRACSSDVERSDLVGLGEKLNSQKWGSRKRHAIEANNRSIARNFALDAPRLPRRCFDWFWAYDCSAICLLSFAIEGIDELCETEWLLRWSSEERIPAILKVSKHKTRDGKTLNDESVYFVVSSTGLTKRITDQCLSVVEGKSERVQSADTYSVREKVTFSILGLVNQEEAVHELVRGPNSKDFRGIFQSLKREGLFVTRTGYRCDQPIPQADLELVDHKKTDKSQYLLSAEKLGLAIDDLRCRCSSYVGRSKLDCLFDPADGTGDGSRINFRGLLGETIFMFDFVRTMPRLPTVCLEWVFEYDCLVDESSFGSYSLDGSSYSNSKSLHWSSLENVPGILTIESFSSDYFGGEVKRYAHFLIDSRGLTERVRDCYIGLVQGTWKEESLYLCDVGGRESVHLRLRDRWYQFSSSGAARIVDGEAKWDIFKDMEEIGLLVACS